jgi:phage I-like protein
MRIQDLGGNFAFYVPITFSADSPTPVWVLQAQVGDWYNARHGEVPITRGDLTRMFENFKSGAYPSGLQKLPVDYEHLSTKEHRKPGDGVASGWILDLELRGEGKELWGLIDWTEPARSKIQKKEYAGYSPLFHPNWITHGKKELGPTLLGGALTNYQTIPNCVVTCSLDPTMATRSLADIADLPLSDRERRIREAFDLQYPTVKNLEGYTDWEKSRWFRDADAENAYFSFGGKIYGLKYTADAALTITFEGEPFEVVSRYEPLVSLSGESIMKLKNAQGQEIEIPAASLAGLSLDALAEIPAVRDLRAQVPATGTKVVDVKEFDTLTTTVQTLSTTVDALKTENAGYKKIADESAAKLLDQEVTALIAQGRMLPSEKEGMVELANTNRALFDKMITARKAAAPLVVVGIEHGSGGSGVNTGSPVVQFDALVDTIKKADPKMSYVDAIKLAANQNPELAKARNIALSLPVGPGGVAMATA